MKCYRFLFEYGIQRLDACSGACVAPAASYAVCILCVPSMSTSTKVLKIIQRVKVPYWQVGEAS